MVMVAVSNSYFSRLIAAPSLCVSVSLCLCVAMSLWLCVLPFYSYACSFPKREAKMKWNEKARRGEKQKLKSLIVCMRTTTTLNLNLTAEFSLFLITRQLTEIKSKHVINKLAVNSQNQLFRQQQIPQFYTYNNKNKNISFVHYKLLKSYIHILRYITKLFNLVNWS